MTSDRSLKLNYTNIPITFYGQEIKLVPNKGFMLDANRLQSVNWNNESLQGLVDIDLADVLQVVSLSSDYTVYCTLQVQLYE